MTDNRPMTDRCEPPPELRGVDGWHWVQPHDWEPIPARWHAAENAGNEPRWTSSHHVPSGTPAWAYEHWGYRYLSPVATPAEVEALRAERDALAKQVTIPGVWRCAKCEFRLVQSNLNAADGTVTARDTPGDKCPNCAAPLWRVTYKNDNAEAIQLAERFCQEAFTLRARVAELEGVLRTLDTEARYMAQQLADRGLPGVKGDCVDRALDAARAALSPTPTGATL